MTNWWNNINDKHGNERTQQESDIAFSQHIERNKSKPVEDFSHDCDYPEETSPEDQANSDYDTLMEAFND
jgi:hypothetical protein